MVGRTIGNYIVKKKIGEGGMGAVYTAEHPRIGRRVAIKVLHPEHAKNPETVTRFFNEARAANAIHNEHIIEVLDFGELEDGTSYFIMEWLDGKSLADLLRAEPSMPLSRSLHIADGVGRALSAAHKHGIIHRDLKPDNIYIVERTGDHEFVKVLDFGIAKLLMDPSHHGEADVEIDAEGFKTRTGAILGTPSYMSPEQCRGQHDQVDARSDVYALGVILYQMVTGQRPFVAHGLGGMLLAQMTQTPAKPSSIVPSLPPGVEAAILRALEKERQNRFDTVDEFLKALHQGAVGSDLNAHPVFALTRPIEIGTIPPTPPTTLSGTAAEVTSSATRAQKGRTGMVFGAAALVAVAAALVFALHKSPPPAPIVVPPTVAIPPAVPPTVVAPLAPLAPPTVAPPTVAATAAIAPHPIAPQNTPLPPSVSPHALASHPTASKLPGAPNLPSAPVKLPGAPSLPVPDAPADARVTIHVTPADAELTVDDEAVRAPYSGSFRKSDAHHRVVVRAHGYKTEMLAPVFDRDRDLEVRLARDAEAHVATHAVDPPKATEPPPPGDVKPIYKGTKAKLITEFPQ